MQLGDDHDDAQICDDWNVRVLCVRLAHHEVGRPLR
jgi:hypothetical protein